MTESQAVAGVRRAQSAVTRRINRWPLQSFVLLTFAISWPTWGALAVYDLAPGVDRGGLLWLLGGLGPPIAAVVVLGISEGTDAVRELLARLVLWRVNVRWYAIAVLLPGSVVGVNLIIDAVLFDLTTPLPSLNLLPLFIVSVLANILIGGGMEEIGWRGYALPRLQKEYSALTASLILAVVWVGWHAPLFIVPGAIQSELAPGPFLVQGVALAVLFTWLYNSTSGSLLLAVLLHGTVNAWLTSVWFLRGSISSTTLWVFAALLTGAAGIVVVVYGRADLSRRDRQVAVSTGSSELT